MSKKWNFSNKFLTNEFLFLLEKVLNIWLIKWLYYVVTLVSILEFFPTFWKLRIIKRITFGYKYRPNLIFLQNIRKY